MMQDPVVQGIHAARLRDDEMFQEAMDRAYKAIIAQWEQSETVADREKAHSRLLALKEILRGLASIENDGAVEAHNRKIDFPPED